VEILTTYRPDHIYTLSEFDSHTDHSTSYRLLTEAIAAVHAADATFVPVMHKTFVWAGNFEVAWPTPGDPQTYHEAPDNLADFSPLNWSERESLDVPLAMQDSDLTANLKQRALESHISQGHAFDILLRFVHKDEVFWSENQLGANQPPRAAAGFDQTVLTSAIIQLDGTGSADPEDDPLTFTWTQLEGPAVTLTGADTATPSFPAPAGLTEQVVCAFQLIVNDGQFSSAPDLVHIRFLPILATNNIAPLATVAASSENAADDQLANRAVDGVVDGYPGDFTKEWATNGEGAGAWLDLTWGAPYLIDRITLYDRPNLNDQITGATSTLTSVTDPAGGANAQFFYRVGLALNP